MNKTSKDGSKRSKSRFGCYFRHNSLQFLIDGNRTRTHNHLVWNIWVICGS